MRRAGTAHWNRLRELTANAVRLGLRMVRGLANTDGAAIVAEGLRPIPSSQPENKNSPRQLESEAGLSHGIPRPISGDSRRGGPPSIGEPCWTTTMCCLRTASQPLSQAGLQSHQRDSAPAFHVIKRERAVSRKP